jgi:hypothetical protein
MESKVFNKPDLKGKRFRQDVHHILDLKFYKAFKEKYPKYKDINNKELRKICINFHNLFCETVIDKRDGVELPEGLGNIFIGTCQTSKKKNIDYGKSNKYGVIVTNTNWGTDNKLAKIFYSNYATKYNFINRELWAFIGCRLFKRAVAKTYSTNWPIYIQVDPMKKIRKMFTASRHQAYLKDMENERLKTYNEFDI